MRLDCQIAALSHSEVPSALSVLLSILKNSSIITVSEVHILCIELTTTKNDEFKLLI
jgi:hypothetical protein